MIKKPLLVLAAIIIIVASYFLFLSNPIQRHLWSWQVSLDLSGFKLTSFSSHQTGASSTDNFEATNGEIKVKITKTLVQDNQKLLADKQFSLESLFNPTTSPYPEVITNVISCPDSLKPKKQSVEKGVIYSLYSGERFNYGICSEDLIKFKSRYGIFDCSNKGVFEIMAFGQDDEELDLIMQSFHC